MSFDWSAVKPKHDKPFCRLLPAPDLNLWEQMKHYLWERNLDFQTAYRNLWYPSSQAGDEVPRIVMPATSRIPHNLFWQARAMVGSTPKRYQSPHASRGDSVIVVYPTVREGRETKRSVVVEGPMDALAAAGHGYTAIALMGINPPELTYHLTNELTRGTIVLCVADSDQPQAMINSMNILTALGATCKLVSCAPDKDLADASYSRRREILTG